MAVYNIPGQQTTIGSTRLTVLEFGTGVFRPISTKRSFARVTLVSGGQGGASGVSSPVSNQSVTGGAGGNVATYWLKLVMDEYAYVVGAGGAATSGAGGTTTFGTISVGPAGILFPIGGNATSGDATITLSSPGAPFTFSFSEGPSPYGGTAGSGSGTVSPFTSGTLSGNSFMPRTMPIGYSYGANGGTSSPGGPSPGVRYSYGVEGLVRPVMPDNLNTVTSFGGHSLYGYGGIANATHMLPPKGYGGGGAGGYTPAPPGGNVALHRGGQGGPGAIIIEETLL